MSKTPWTEQETAIVIDGMERGLTPIQITKLLEGRTRSSVVSKIKTLGWGNSPEGEAPRRHYGRRERNKSGDFKFKIAMLDAIRGGLEHAPIGVIRNYRPIERKIFFPAAIFSGCASSAAYCADLGIDNGAR